jgi:hypothetical protein
MARRTHARQKLLYRLNYHHPKDTLDIFASVTMLDHRHTMISPHLKWVRITPIPLLACNQPADILRRKRNTNKTNFMITDGNQDVSVKRWFYYMNSNGP